MYVANGYWSLGFTEGEAVGNYVASGYVADGYVSGGGYQGAVTVVKYFRIDVKNSSTKTKTQTLYLAKQEVEMRQSALPTKAVYADVYDPRDKTITRIYSNVSIANGFSTGNIPFGGDTTQISSITNRLTTVENQAEYIETTLNTTSQDLYNRINNATNRITVVENNRVPKIKVVTPFEATVIDTMLTDVNGIYTFEFDSSVIGEGNYTIEMEFVE